MRYKLHKPTTIWWIEDGMLKPTWVYTDEKLDYHLRENGDKGFPTFTHGFLTVREDIRVTARDHPEIVKAI